MHTGPGLAALIHMLSGSSRPSTEEGIIEPHPGVLDAPTRQTT
ncbi:hypothetical protein [Mycobacterium basiliense]|nr:hypothetical protein [Mycobacterium basiliense]